MKNTQLSAYIGKPTSQIRELFDDIRDAFDDVNIQGGISLQVADLYMSGSTPSNYHMYLDRLSVVDLLAEQGGYKRQDAEMLLKSGFFDPWIMLKSAAAYTLDLPLPGEFEALIIDPLDSRLKTAKDAKKEKAEALAKARETIDGIVKPLKQCSDELRNVKPWIMAGSFEESVKIFIDKLLHDLSPE